jgi:hypothetical protein
MILSYIYKGVVLSQHETFSKLNLQVSHEFGKVGIKFGLSLIRTVEIRSSSRESEVLMFAQSQNSYARNSGVLVRVRSSDFHTKSKDNLLLHLDSKLDALYMFIDHLDKRNTMEKFISYFHNFTK